AALARQIRSDSIDILIETSGLTLGHRLPMLATRPAPVQVSYCGYPATTGVPAIDYRIVDGRTDPPDAPWLGAERLLRLDPVFLCYKPPAEAPEPAPRDGPVTFGSFNAAMKLNDGVIALWTRLLSAIPGSRLVLKAFDFEDEQLRTDVT